MERTLSDRLKEVAIADHLYMCLAAAAEMTRRKVDAIVVMPGVGESSRIIEAMRLASSRSAERLVCTGTNPEERARGELYDEAKLLDMYRTFSGLGLPPMFRIEADPVGNHSRMQAENAVRRLKTERPNGLILHVAGPWHGPRSYLTLLQACLEAYGTFERMPTIYPFLVPVPLADATDAVSDAHLASGYRESLPAAIAAEIDRRIRYEDAGHVMPLVDFQRYFYHFTVMA